MAELPGESDLERGWNAGDSMLRQAERREKAWPHSVVLLHPG